MPKLFNFGRQNKEVYSVSVEASLDDESLRDVLPNQVLQNLKARGVLVDRKWERAQGDPVSGNIKSQDKETLVNRVGIRETPRGNQLMVGYEWQNKSDSLNTEATVHFDLYDITPEQAIKLAKKLR